MYVVLEHNSKQNVGNIALLIVITAVAELNFGAVTKELEA
jgi:hypothetical protein